MAGGPSNIISLLHYDHVMQMHWNYFIGVIFFFSVTVYVNMILFVTKTPRKKYLEKTHRKSSFLFHQHILSHSSFIFKSEN